MNSSDKFQNKMLKSFSTKQLIFIALMGAILFVMDLAVSGISVAIGIPGAGGLLNTIFFVALATIGGRVIKKFGAFTMMALIYAILAVPNTTFGPPGLYKIPLALFIGLLADCIAAGFNYSNKSCYFSLPIANVLSIPLGLFAMSYLGLPGAEELAKYLWLFMGLYLVESEIGAWIGIVIYNKKLNKVRIINQISE